MNVADPQRPRPGELFLDHVSHFVPDLDAAARVLEQLGFCVTPLSVQLADGKPAGTANRCVMLEAGYLEFLAPTGVDTPNARRLRERIDRFAGVHLACFGTPDAEAEHRRLDAHGFGVLPVVDLERKVESGATVRFKVVRVEPEAMPEGRIQYVQHLAPEHIWTERNLAHDNGVIGLDAVYVVADDRAEAAARWARFAALLPRPDGDHVVLRTARGAVIVGGHVELTRTLGAMPVPPALAGYALKCRDAARFAARCRDAGLRVERNVVTLPPSMGGCWLLT
jgi:hypothetical protein